MNKFFSYSGNKLKYINEINTLVNKFDCKVYIEPFVGSGAILFNLWNQFDKYIINDIDKNIIKMYKSFRNILYIDYKNQIEFIAKEFGDIKENKQSYYDFRNWFNENWYDTNTIEEGIYLHFLTNSCINSFLRFGKKGMNQSFGKRLYILDEQNFNNIKATILKTEIYNGDYKDVIEYNGLYFMDPPYFNTNTSYKSQFSEDNIKEFINIFSKLNYVIYTDDLNEYNKDIENRFLLRKRINTSPNRKSNITNKEEYIFYKGI